MLAHPCPQALKHKDEVRRAWGRSKKKKQNLAEPASGLAGYTNLWRLALVRGGKYHTSIKELHEKFGPVVRIGPNLLDLDYPELIKTIYSTDGKWHKVRCVSHPSHAV